MKCITKLLNVAIASALLASAGAALAETSPIEELQKDMPNNWTKWGKENQIGALNYLDNEQALRGVKAVKTGETKFIPKQWEKTFFNWMENIQPWCISRQLWWGHQIPAYYYGDGTNDFVVAESLEDAVKKAQEKTIEK